MLTLEELKERALSGVSEYNSRADPSKRIVRIELFGCYASDIATESSDVDLLVEFAAPAVGFFTLAAVLNVMEKATRMSVDIVQTPLPDDSLLEIERSSPLYTAA